MFSASLLGIATGLLLLFGVTLAGARSMVTGAPDPAVLDAAKSRPTADPELPAPAALPTPEPVRATNPKSPRPRDTSPSPWGASPSPAPSTLTRGFLFDPPGALARVRIDGDYRSVSLVGPDGPHAPGDVPPGHYRLDVAFGNAKPRTALEIDVRGGDSLVVECSSRAGCAVRK